MAANKLEADLVLKNAVVWTVDSDLPRAEAIAARGNEIAGVGSDSDIEAFIGAGTKVYDMGGRLVLPGFNDSHTHFMSSTSRMATSMNLLGIASLAVPAWLKYNKH
jgi:predicted amidohydrolase YtcJ